MPLACLVAWLIGGAEGVFSAELYPWQPRRFGRFEAQIQFAHSDGVISSFFLWKKDSYLLGTFWNELDFEKVGLDIEGRCKLQLNVITGLPGPVENKSAASGVEDICTRFHTYGFEWTPDYIAWVVDGVELRREVGEQVEAFERYASEGLEMRFNVWPGDTTFGGTFALTDLPVYQYIDWVRYSAFNGTGFTEAWLETFAGDSIPEGWLLGNWDSPKGLSHHNGPNVVVVNGCAVLELTNGLPTERSSLPPPGPKPGAKLEMTVLSLDHHRLMRDAYLRGSFEDAVKQAIAAAAGDAVTAAHIALRLTAPAVTVQARITPPDGVLASEVAASLRGENYRGAIASGVAARLRASSAISAVASGTIFVTGVRVSSIGGP